MLLLEDSFLINNLKRKKMNNFYVILKFLLNIYNAISYLIFSFTDEQTMAEVQVTYIGFHNRQVYL